MRKIKKYSNRKLYDTRDKTYISLNRVAELVMEGEEVQILDSKTGEDLTSGTISQILARDKDVPPSVLVQILQKGQGTFQETLHGTVSLARRYASLWQSAFSAAEGEMDRLVNRMVKDQEISEKEVTRFKREMKGQVGSFKAWVAEKIDQRVAEALSSMNLATREQAEGIIEKLEQLEKRIQGLEGKAPGQGEDSGPGNVVKLSPTGTGKEGAAGKKTSRAR
ncbi:MAG: hypothetical protein KKA60_14835 [Proteobacteria bacterium]|nr:hypothetical protein [Pseudomonadota bacterium]